MPKLELVSPGPRVADKRIQEFLASESAKDTLRFLTCGGVEDGKSTLLGRLLYDLNLIREDQLALFAADSHKQGTTGGDFDFALLVDGLMAEREQGTIDVAYRFFATPKRKFIVADSPGHEQYARNMATGASNSDFAVLLVDARQGIVTQTRRHACILSLLGMRKAALAVNKMDLVGYSKERFEAIADEFAAFARQLGFDEVVAVPISALKGDNVIRPSANMHWYHGPTLMAQLETVDVSSGLASETFRMPVQWVNRASANLRGYAGTILTGSLSPGDPVMVLPSGRTSTVVRIVTHDGDLESANAGDAVTLTLADEIDISRGDVIVAPKTPVSVSDQIAAHVVWMSSEPMLPGRAYLLKAGPQSAIATVTALKHKINVNTLEHIAGRTLELNEVANCNIGLNRPLVFDPYRDNRDMGSFILVDRFTNETIGAGMIEFGLRRATNIQWQALDIDKAARSGLKGQRPCVLWFTGLSGAGKSTVASLLEKKLHERGRHTYVLDGDNVRHGLNKDLGFTDADRVENIRRVAETAKLFIDAGLIVLVSFISPFRSERRMARELLAEEEFIEVFIDTPLKLCEERDPKGLYKKARAGLIKNFTGIDSVYERPESPDIRLQTASRSPEALADELIAQLERRKLI